MDERTRRIGENEILFREVNERLIQLNEELQVDREQAAFLCECGNADCVEKVVLSLADYQRVRADPAMFAVVKGHEEADVETVLEEVDGVALIHKKPGEPAALAARHDPRSP